MEKLVQFRDYQEQTSADHNNIQAFARQSIDHVVDDVVTKSNRYAGFAVVKSAQAEVQVALGRFYQAGGGVFSRASALTQSMTPYLATTSKRIVAVSVYGQENDTDVTERDFLVNVETGETEPDSVAMTRARDAVLTFTSGAESADPQPPAVPGTHCVIAHVLVDAIQVVSVSMQVQNAVQSTENLDQRAKLLEAFKAAIEPRVASLGSDISALATQIHQAGSGVDISRLYVDMARVKEELEFPDEASDYGADRFKDEDGSDVDNTAALGYDAAIAMGVRFPDANASITSLNVFSANDPNMSLQNGMVLPAYDDVLKMSIDPYHSEVGMAGYGFQTFELVEKTVARQRIRYGGYYAWYGWDWYYYHGYWPGYVLGYAAPAYPYYSWWFGYRYVRYYWYETYYETYTELETVDHTITGAMVAQTFLNANDTWLTKVGFYVTSKAAEENVFMSICELTAGMPDLEKVILHQVIPHGSLVNNGWVRVAIKPTFLNAGRRYAVVLTSNANHKIGMAYGQNYLDGTFFYSTDSVFYTGDLTKDMMLELYGARFKAPQVAIEMNALNLDGGIWSIDILAQTVVPKSTQLVYEVQPNGTGEWVPLTEDDTSAFNGVPPLARFRARFVGTRDVMPAVILTGSEVTLRRPKTAFKHISKEITLAGPSDAITVRFRLNGFNDTPHDFACRLRVGAGWEDPDVTADVVIDAANGVVDRTFTFNLGAETSTFTIEATGTTNNATSTFYVSERVHYAV